MAFNSASLAFHFGLDIEKQVSIQSKRKISDEYSHIQQLGFQSLLLLLKCKSFLSVQLGALKS
jgi:hypothetical protein